MTQRNGAPRTRPSALREFFTLLFTNPPPSFWYELRNDAPSRLRNAALLGLVLLALGSLYELQVLEPGRLHLAIALRSIGIILSTATILFSRYRTDLARRWYVATAGLLTVVYFSVVALLGAVVPGGLDNHYYVAFMEVAFALAILLPLPPWWMGFLLLYGGTFYLWSTVALGGQPLDTLFSTVAATFGISGLLAFTVHQVILNWRWRAWENLRSERRLRAKLDEHNRRLASEVAARTAHLSAALAKLRASEERYRVMAQTGLYVLVELTPRGEILAYGDPAHPFLGRRLSLQKGTPLDLEIVPEDLPHLATAIQRAQDALSPARTTFRVLGPDHEPRWLEAAGRFLRDGEGLRGIALLRDITEERALQELVHHQETLASLGRMAAGIAHDFNNNLAVLKGWVELLGHKLPPSHPEFVPILAELEHTIGSAEQLVAQILEFAGRAPSEPVPIELSHLLRHLSPMLHRILPRRIRLETDLPEDPLWCRLDRARLERALLNLAANAREAMAGEGRLTIRLRSVATIPQERGTVIRAPSSDEGPFVELVVTDEGTGIPPELHRRIFEPFFTTRRQQGGTGLGLAQVVGLVEQYDGALVLESEPGRGTTFRLYFPQLTDVESVPKPAGTPRKPDRPRRRRAPKGVLRGRVLVVEDEPSVRDLLLNFLKASGLDCRWATSAEEAVALLEEHGPVDLLLSDLSLGGQDGLWLAEQAERRGWARRIVLMTGHPVDGSWEHLRHPAVHQWLQKPFYLADLHALLAEQLEARRAP